MRETALESQIVSVVRSREACNNQLLECNKNGSDRTLVLIGGAASRRSTYRHVQRVQLYSRDESLQRVQESILYGSHRCIRDDVYASQAQLLAGKVGEYEREIESDALDGVRDAARTSDGEAVIAEKHSMV